MYEWYVPTVIVYGLCVDLCPDATLFPSMGDPLRSLMISVLSMARDDECSIVRKRGAALECQQVHW